MTRTLRQWLSTPDRLPRDGRDTLFMLVVIGWVLAPQVNHLPLWCSLVAAGALGWRGWLAWHTRALPSRWWLRALLLITVLATLWSHKTIFGRDAGVTLIAVLLALKTLELHAKRDAFVVFFLSFFMMLTSFFYSQSLLSAAAMLIALLGLLTALVNAHLPVGRPPLRRSARIAGTMALLGAPVMLVLFLLFPRIAPLWGLPSDSMSGRSGLSGSMQVGSIASLALDDSVAMLIRFEGATPNQSNLYFRGPVLSSFDGKSWQTLHSGLPQGMQLAANLTVNGQAVDYQITLEPNQRPWLITLDATPDKPTLRGFEVQMNHELQWLTDRPIGDLIRYRARSYPEFSHGPLSFRAGLQDYLNLPDGFNPRTLQLAAALRQTVGNAEGSNATLVTTVMERLRTGGYSYTLEPGEYGRHSADEFWFDRKEGFCEHMASSFVILMRALGIPARIVTGYQGGERNAVDGFWVVRQSDAHAWTEVWLNGRGWVRVDPTSAVAPGRTGAFQRLLSPRNAIASAWLGEEAPKFARHLRAYWEAINNGWNQWILNYSQTRQFELLKGIGFESPGWEDLLYLLFGIVILSSVLGALWTLWEHQRQDPWRRLLDSAATRLRKSGMPIDSGASPRLMANRLRQQLGGEHPSTVALCTWLLQLEAQRYAPHSSSQAQARELATLQHAFKQLPWPS